MGSRSGELAMRPLPAVLLDLHEDLATGQLVLKRGRVSKTVDLLNGNPVSTASTPRDETLGHFLVSSGVITEEDHREAVTRAAQIGGKLGEALVALRVLTVEQLIDQLGKQARHKLVQALRWPQGAWRFDESFDPIEGMQLRMVEVVLGGLRETAVEDLQRLARLDGMSFELTERGKRLRPELKRVFGERVCSLLATGATIADLERAFPDRAAGRLAIDAMILCDAVTALSEPVAGLGMVPVPAGLAPLPVVARAPTRPPAASSELFDILFDDIGIAPEVETEGAAPLEFPDVPEEVTNPEDSGVVSISELDTVSVDRDQATGARQSIAAELQRIKGADFYAVLKINRKAAPLEIENAYIARTGESDHSAVLKDPRDRVKLDELNAAYSAAREVLIDERKRTNYDRELAGGELVQVAPAIDTELSFRTAEELMVRKQWDQAIGMIKTVISRSPNEADYHAALGWAEWNAGHESPQAGDTARGHLNQALTINPDHPASHFYKGKIEAKLSADDTEALFHLERAIDLEPTRVEALAAIEQLLVGRGELRRLERSLKRVLFRLRGKGNVAEAKAWARLSRLYLDHLDDPAAGSAAAATARKIAPKDSDVASLITRTESTRRNTLEPIRAGWREALSDPHSGAALVNTTAASGHADAAFLAASTMVALATADTTMAALYESHKVTGANLPQKALGRDQWALLRHKDDNVELGGLMELVAPAIHALAPMTLADSDLDPSMQLTEADIPPAFNKLRAKFAMLLGVSVPLVYPRVELGKQIHVVACDPPVLVAGDDALTSPDRPELVFRMARAMTFLWPGRAVGASRPGRVLRAIVMAILREASGSTVGAEDPLAKPAADAVASLPQTPRVQARAAAMRLLSRGGALNLSLWARSLSRTADRVGMLMSGDVPAAFAGAAEIGELDRDLQEFAYSAAHVNLRTQLGLSRG
jgi:tetratricopeptide (TPR) repeat protein